MLLLLRLLPLIIADAMLMRCRRRTLPPGVAAEGVIHYTPPVQARCEVMRHAFDVHRCHATPLYAPHTPLLRRWSMLMLLRYAIAADYFVRSIRARYAACVCKRVRERVREADDACLTRLRSPTQPLLQR